MPKTFEDVLAAIANKPIYGSTPVYGSTPNNFAPATTTTTAKPVVAVPIARQQKPVAPVNIPDKTDIQVFSPPDTGNYSKTDDSFSGVAGKSVYTDPDDMGPATPEQQSALSRFFSAVIDDSQQDKDAGIDTTQPPQEGIIGKIRDYMTKPRQGVSNQPVTPSQASMTVPNSPANSWGQKLYAAINHAEMNGIDNQFIRTMYKPKDNTSTAYGPLQITTTLATDYLQNKPDMFSDSEKNYLQRFIQQGQKFKDFDAGKVKDKRFGYGGSGILTSDKDQALYQDVGTKMLTDIAAKNNNNPQKTWKEWRFGVAKRGQDAAYGNRFMTALNSTTDDNGY